MYNTLTITQKGNRFLEPVEINRVFYIQKNNETLIRHSRRRVSTNTFSWRITVESSRSQEYFNIPLERLTNEEDKKGNEIKNITMSEN